ncbi:MAG: pilus assembly protein [Actinobacteria bacterium]|nr:pilus assembly protein [Actinomycetota bacterium]
MTRDERGQSTVELALCLPIVVIVLAVLVQVGVIAIDHVKVWHAAREAARIAAVDPDVEAIERAAGGVGLRDIDVSVEPEGLYRRQGEPVTVVVSYSPSTSVPIIGSLFDGLTLDAEASMRIEQP